MSDIVYMYPHRYCTYLPLNWLLQDGADVTQQEAEQRLENTHDGEGRDADRISYINGGDDMQFNNGEWMIELLTLSPQHSIANHSIAYRVK